MPDIHSLILVTSPERCLVWYPGTSTIAMHNISDGVIHAEASGYVNLPWVPASTSLALAAMERHPKGEALFPVYMGMYSGTGEAALKAALHYARQSTQPTTYITHLDKALEGVAQEHPEVDDTAVRDRIHDEVAEVCEERLWDLEAVARLSSYLSI